MKKALKLFFALIFFPLAAITAQNSNWDSAYSYEYREAAKQLLIPSAPFEKDGLLIFSAEEGPHFVGIAFDFEDYKTIHRFQKKTIYDENEQKSRAWYFFILENYPETKRILYRLIIDGLWTTDPLNKNQVYDISTGITLSEITVNREYYAASSATSKADGAHFVFRTSPGQKVRVAGTFSNWDSWIYEMKETERGLYELTLPLPQGTYYYLYYIGTKAFVDTTNPSRAYKDDGQVVSKLIVP